jgi:hypothetical protein
MKYYHISNEAMTSINEELLQYVKDNVSNYDCLEEDLHHELFNRDYYLIGYYRCEQWLKKHNVNIFDGIAFVQDYERENFGDDAVRIYDNAEKLVNMIVYILSENIVPQYLENQKKLDEIFKNDPYGLLD